MRKIGALRGRVTVLVVAVLSAVMLLAGAGSAQTPEGEARDVSHPAHIHAGTCANLGEVVYPLADVAYPEGEVVGSESALPLKVSLSVLDVPFADLLAAEHAVNVHLSADEIDTYIACGDIGGVATPQQPGDNELEELWFGAGELNDSGHVGWVYLGNEGDQTAVNVLLYPLEGLD